MTETRNTISVQDVELVQSRVDINWEIVSDYAQAMQEGAQFPPVDVVRSAEGQMWCWDGCHRIYAARRAGINNFDANVTEGTRRDAVLKSLGANSTHGLRRTRQDKRNAVTTLLRDEEWGRWSDREIARHAGVHHQMVGRLRTELSPDGSSSERTYRTRHGTTATMNTSRIRQSNQGRGETSVPLASRTSVPPSPAPATQESSRPRPMMQEIGPLSAPDPEVHLSIRIAPGDDPNRTVNVLMTTNGGTGGTLVMRKSTYDELLQVVEEACGEYYRKTQKANEPQVLAVAEAA